MLADYINCPATPGGPMTGPDHYRQAEQLINSSTSTNQLGVQIVTRPEFIAVAQTHALLALAAATALDSDRREEWLDVAGGSSATNPYKSRD
jgi:hypothetical protein